MDIDPIQMFRGIERLLIIVGAIFSLWVAQRIYTETQQQLGEAFIKTDTITIELKKVGPSTFFALFGTIILVISLYQTLEVSNTSKTTSLKGEDIITESTETYRYLSDKKHTRLKEELKEINSTFLAIASFETSLRSHTASFTKSEEVEIADLIRKLDGVPATFVDVIYGKGMYEKYDSATNSCLMGLKECESNKNSLGHDVYNEINLFLEK